MQNVTGLLSKSNHVSLATELQASVSLCHDKRVKLTAEERKTGPANGRAEKSSPSWCYSRVGRRQIYLLVGGRCIIVSGPNEPSADFTASSLALGQLG